ncbi:hypothetical protein IWQ62_000331 [Dispira parvispora]|uniref:COX assembly mitochondrial protein n=1 Tax=Dispira parvispora TaxID=1520584 RepID=A0A9W8AUZ7_9FUNG|nr:hypothetical protein IWQ62_000331 [Dispira parvispora]
MSQNSSRSTIHVLTAREEEEATKAWKKNSMTQCASFIQAFSECASGRTVSVVWACRDLHKAMNDCLHQYSTPEIRDQIRKDMIEKKRNKDNAAS